MRMQKEFPDEYNFFPVTFMLPHDFKEFMALLGEKRNKTFIVKPEASSQGKGIFLTRNPELLLK
jgi:tubulin polyglutamylase TTLL6/13